MNTARYSVPFCECFAVNVKVTRRAPGMLVHVLPPLIERCHCVLGAGVPEAAAVKPARPPGDTFMLWGWTITAGRRWPPRGRAGCAGAGRSRINGSAATPVAVRRAVPAVVLTLCGGRAHTGTPDRAGVRSGCYAHGHDDQPEQGEQRARPDGCR